MSDLQQIEVALLEDHPQNPRLVIREDVVEGIVANLGDEWPKKHALHVRPIGGKYQIISGHHRKRAAEAKGLEAVWCWVEEMDDDAAYMALATSNNQGELSPLEIGLHALHCETLAKGGRGKKGGLSAYAERVGRTKQSISILREAAQVLDGVKGSICIDGLLSKTHHLAAIHKLPKHYWEGCCEWLAKQEKCSVAEVKERVDEALSFEVPECQCEGYLAERICRPLVFRGLLDQPTAKRLADLCDKVAESLDDELRERWFAYLVQYAGEDSYNLRQCQDKRIELETKQYEKDNAEAEADSEVVEVLLADPPWRYDFSETDSRQIENQYPTADAEEIARHLELPWAPQLADDCVLFMWATAPKLREAFVVLDGWGFEYKTHAVWDKEKIGMGYWFRGQHELLIVATRGSFSPPESDKRFPSVFREKRDSKHSKKPDCVYQAIEQMFPKAVKFEMYSRQSREGWLSGGNES